MLIVSARLPKSSMMAMLMVGAIAGSGCQSLTARLPGNSPPASPAPVVPAVPLLAQEATNEATGDGAPTPLASDPSPAPIADGSEFYDQGISRGSIAYHMAQTARTPADWDLVESRWQQAIALFQAVSAPSPKYAQAQAKISEYQQYVQTAQARAADLRGQAAGQRPSATPGQKRSFRTRIVSRAAGIPIVLVHINGQDLVPMIVDTGASSVVITAATAQSLGIPVTGTTYAAIADGTVVAFGMGQAQSLDVNGARVENLPVTIAPPALDVGLLGNTFLSRYDINVQQDWIVFRER